MLSRAAIDTTVEYPARIERFRQGDADLERLRAEAFEHGLLAAGRNTLSLDIEMKLRYQFET